MRLTYYRFPEETSENLLLENGCRVIYKGGGYDWPKEIPAHRRNDVVRIETSINCNVSKAKKLLKKYGGYAWTEHIDRDGGVFETSEVTLTGNNSRFRYIRHL